MSDPITHLVEKIIDSRHDLRDKKALLNEVRKIMAPEQNRWNFRFAIWTLATVAISIPVVVIVNLCKAEATNNVLDVPDGLLSLGSAAIGALAAFLTPYAQRTQGGTSTSGTAAAPGTSNAASTGTPIPSDNISPTVEPNNSGVTDAQTP
jgi:hypothetical protein